MVVHLSDKKKYNKYHSYEKKMSYTISVFGVTYKFFEEIKNNPLFNTKYIIWYLK